MGIGDGIPLSGSAVRRGIGIGIGVMVSLGWPSEGAGVTVSLDGIVTTVILGVSAGEGLVGVSVVLGVFLAAGLGVDVRVFRGSRVGLEATGV